MKETVQPEPVVIRGSYDVATGEIVGMVVLSAPFLSIISKELLEEMDPKYRDDDVITLTPEVRYLIGDEYGEHGDRLLHRLP